jgi:hypothetical protein
MNDSKWEWHPYVPISSIEPLDEHLPTPDKMWKSWMRSRRGLWFYDLHAGYDWSIDTAYDQWIALALRMGWIDRDPLAPK